jgi:hypothetical protein
MKELISKKTRYELAEYLSGFVLREIDHECEAVDIVPDRAHDPGCSGQRRTLARQYLHGLDYTKEADARKFLALCENMLNGADARSPFVEKFPKWLQRDGYVFENGRVVAVSHVTSLSRVHALAVEFDARHMQEQIARMSAAVDTDPALAIGSAKELLETCCKTILAERGKAVTGIEDLPALVKVVRAELRLVPEDVPQAAKGAETIKRLLSNLGTVAQGLAELRSLYGTGHGRDGRSRGLKPRHARLAVGAASALAVFLFETHKELGE